MWRFESHIKQLSAPGLESELEYLDAERITLQREGEGGWERENKRERERMRESKGGRQRGCVRERERAREGDSKGERERVSPRALELLSLVL